MNKTMLQYFEWYLPSDGSLWRQLAENATKLKEQGFSDIWMPPAYKGAGGESEVGYAVYDLYDLGEFDQKGTVRTKYGTKDEYLNAINALHNNGLRAMADIVLNHRMGADYAEKVKAQPVSDEDRTEATSDEQLVSAWTGFNFPGRHDKYSNFHWNHTHFTGVNGVDPQNADEVFQFDKKSWDEDVDKEHGNYDFLMGSDVDVDNPEVVKELDSWGKWYLEMTHVDALRLDAVKHIGFKFFTHWLEELRRESGQELWAVGEYWQRDVRALTNYLDESGNIMALFDAPLHYNFQAASQSGADYDMRGIFAGTLTEARPEHSVTFVDNHDSQPDQALASWVEGWFKPLAYALILLREQGVPCVFYGDLYGIPFSKIDPVGDRLPLMIEARAKRAYGEQVDYFDDKNVVGWTRQGDEEHPGSGLAVVLSNGDAGAKEMSMGVGFAGKRFVDLLGNHPDEVEVDEAGRGLFPCSAGSVSVWVPREG